MSTNSIARTPRGPGPDKIRVAVATPLVRKTLTDTVTSDLATLKTQLEAMV